MRNMSQVEIVVLTNSYYYGYGSKYTHLLMQMTILSDFLTVKRRFFLVTLPPQVRGVLFCVVGPCYMLMEEK